MRSVGVLARVCEGVGRTRPRVSAERRPARARGVVGRMRGAGLDAGMATIEYAVVALAAAGFAGLLALVLRSDEVRGMLTDLVHRALTL